MNYMKKRLFKSKSFSPSDSRNSLRKSVSISESYSETVCRKQITVLGGGKVGKTNLITRYLYNHFTNDYKPTIEDIYREIVTSNRQVIDLVLLDTAGSFQFPEMRRLAIKKSDAIFIIYGLDDYDSFLEAKRLFSIVEKTCQFRSTIPVVLIGNKFDLNHHTVCHNEVLQLLKTMGKYARHFEVSAKDNFNVTYAFNALFELIKGSELAHNSFSNGVIPRKRISYSSCHDVKQRVRLVFQESIHIQDESRFLCGYAGDGATGNSSVESIPECNRK